MSRIVLVEEQFPHKFIEERELVTSRSVVEFLSEIEKAPVEKDIFIRCSTNVFGVFHLLEIPFYTLSAFASFVPQVEYVGLARLEATDIVNEDKKKVFSKEVEQAKADYEKAAFEKYDGNKLVDIEED